MLSLVQLVSLLFLVFFCLPLGNGTTVSYVSPNKDKSFCMSPGMHEQCGAYCYQTFKPVLEHVVKLTEEIARKNKEEEEAFNFVAVVGSRFMDFINKNVDSLC